MSGTAEDSGTAIASPLADLPIEMQKLIFGFGTDLDRLVVSLVCRRYKGAPSTFLELTFGSYEYLWALCVPLSDELTFSRSRRCRSRCELLIVSFFMR